jgi:hypothetical protein
MMVQVMACSGKVFPGVFVDLSLIFRDNVGNEMRTRRVGKRMV